MLPRIFRPSFVGPLIPDGPEAIDALFGKPTPFLPPIPADPATADFFAIPKPVPPEDNCGTVVETAGEPEVAETDADFAGVGVKEMLVPLFARTVSARL